MPLPISDQTDTTQFAQGISVMDRYGIFSPRAAFIAVATFALLTGVAHAQDGETGWVSVTEDVSAYSDRQITLRFTQVIPETFTGPGRADFDGISLLADGTELLVNGGFESGPLGVSPDGWFTAYVSTGGDADPHEEFSVQESGDNVEGLRWLTSGFDGGGPMEYILEQSVYIPPANSVTVSWSHSLWWMMMGGLPRELHVDVLDDTGAVLNNLYFFSTDGSDPSLPPPVLVMRQDNIEVTEGGDPVTVSFDLLDGEGNSTASADEVRFWVVTDPIPSLPGPLFFEGIDREVILPVGDSSVSLDIAIYDDDQEVGGAIFEVQITEVTSGNATLSVESNSVSVTILDNDAPPAELPVISVVHEMVDVDEDHGVLDFYFGLLDGEGNPTTSADDVIFWVTTDNLGAAGPEPGVDFGPLTSYVATIPAGSVEASVPIDIYDDDGIEGDETFEVMITEVTSGNATLDAMGDSGFVTIVDNDAPPAELPVISVVHEMVDVDEDHGVLDFYFGLLDGEGNPTTSADDVIFWVTTDNLGAAGPEPGVDFGPLTSYVATIPAGSVEASVPIDIYDDDGIEGDETFEVMITEVTSGNATLDAMGDSGFVTIVDNDAPPIFADAYEPNDVWQDAVPLVTDGLDVALTFHYEGHYDPDTGEEIDDGDQDWFSFDAIAGEVYTMTTSNLLQIEAPDGNEVIWTDTELWLYGLGEGGENDPAGLVYIDDNDDSDDDLDDLDDGLASQIMFLAPETATYYVVVDHHSGELGACDFNIASAFDPPPPSAFSADAYEPNDVPEEATELSTNTGHLPDGDGTFHVAGDSPVDWPGDTGTGDHDWYSFEATQGNNYRIAAFDHSDAVTDPALQVYDSALVMLHSNDNEHEEDPDWDGNLAAVIHFEAASSGTHYILVTERYASSGAYNLHIHEWFGDVTVDPSYAEIGGLAHVPISITDTTGVDIDSIGLHLRYDPDVLEPVVDDESGNPIGAAEFLPLVPAEWTRNQNIPEPGTMIVAMAGESENPLEGAGGLVGLTFNVLATEDDLGHNTHVELTQAQMPDGIDFIGHSNHDIYLVQFEYGDVSGKNGVTPHDASLVLDATLESMLGGLFHFPIETDAPEWCPIPILPFDAERVGNVDGSAMVEISDPAGSDGSGGTGLFTGIGSMDASLILQYVVRLIDELPVPPATGAPGLLSSSAVLDLSGPSSSLRPGETFTISLDTAGVSDLYAGEIGLQYDARLVRPVEVFTAGAGSGRVTPQWVHRVKDGTLAAVFASATPVDTGDSLAQVRFETLVDSAHQSVIRASHVRLNRDLVKRQLTYAYQIEPYRFQLLANYPNPFNPETWIPFELAEEADVTIRIYGLDGQHIRTLDLGRYGQGSYTDRDQAAHWDGRNEYGEQVASSMYVYELRAGTYRAMRRMVIRK